MRLIISISLIISSFLGYGQVVLGPQNTPFRESEYIYKKVDTNISARPLLDTSQNTINWDVRNFTFSNESRRYYFTQDLTYKCFPVNFPNWNIPFQHSFDTTFIRSNGFVYRVTQNGLKIVYKEVYSNPDGTGDYWFVSSFAHQHIPFPFSEGMQYFEGVITDKGPYLGCEDVVPFQGLRSTSSYNFTAVKEDSLHINGQSDEALMIRRVEGCVISCGNHCGDFETYYRFEWYFANSEMPEVIVEVMVNGSYDSGSPPSSISDTSIWVLDSSTHRPLLLTSNIELRHHNSTFQIYPNPAQNSFSIELNEQLKYDGSIIRILDLQGRVLLIEKASRNSLKQFDISSLPNGYYLVDLELLDGSRFQEKLIKN